MKIVEDAMRYPHLFHWNGSVSFYQVKSWCDDHHVLPDNALIELMCATGGGDFFETETLLWPLKLVRQPDRDQLVCFHNGLCASYFDPTTQMYFVRGMRMDAERFATIDDWYLRTLRAEYQDRYGITDI